MRSWRTLSAIVISLCLSQSLTPEADKHAASKSCLIYNDTMETCRKRCAMTPCSYYDYLEPLHICELNFIIYNNDINCTNYQQPLTGSITTVTSSVQCGVQADRYQPSLRIIGGKSAVPHSWPWALKVITTYKETIYGCGASLIRVSDLIDASDIAITAAHCVAFMDKEGSDKVTISNEVSVVAGAQDSVHANAITETRAVSDVKILPEYHTKWIFNDLAVLKLSEPLNFDHKIRPICLPGENEPIPTDKLCYTVGWGRIQAHTYRYPAELQQLRMPVHQPHVCKATWADGYNEKSNICAGDIGSNATSDICKGDSGGMLACRGSSPDPWVLYGVTSRGYGKTCLVENKPSIFTRVSTNLEFILEAATNMTSIKLS